MKNLFIVLLIQVLINACSYKNTDNCHKVRTFLNKTDKTLFVDFGSYPLSVAENYVSNPFIANPSFKILPRETNNTALSYGNCLEDSFQKAQKISVFVFDADIVQNTPWETIKANEIYLKRYDLTLQDWQNNNWTITYDGN